MKSLDKPQNALVAGEKFTLPETKAHTNEVSVLEPEGRDELSSNSHEDMTTSEKIAIFETYRKIIIHEDGLINWRITWLVIFQGVLLTAFTQIGLSPNLPEEIPQAVRGSLQWVGLFHSIISFIGVMSATNAIRTLRVHYEKNYAFQYLPPLTGGGYRNPATNLGIIYHLLLPVIFLFIWAYLLAF
jgi:hypothetical protein